MKSKLYFENLDALRGIACLAVMFFHIPTYLVTDKESLFYRILSVLLSFNGQGGKIGVFFFFTLSGFLITYLLYCEKDITKSINIKNFYIRRLLRIWPLYFLIILIGFVIYPCIVVNIGLNYIEKANLLLYISFLSNFDVLYSSFPTNKILGTIWSVAVEEQFYLIWPIFFILIPSKRNLLCLKFIFILSVIFIFFNVNDKNLIYYHTFSCTVYLSFGAILANLLFFDKDKLLNYLNKISKIYVSIIYIISILLMFFFEQIVNVLF